MKAIFFAISVLLSTHVLGQSSAHNSDREKRALVAQITSKIQLDTLIEKQVSALVLMVKNQIPLILAEAAIPESNRGKATAILAKELDAIYGPLLAASKRITIDAYVSAFTADELKELLAFYNTPTGNKLAVILPNLQAQGMQTANQEGQKIATGAMCRAFLEFNKQGIRGGMPPFCK